MTCCGRVQHAGSSGSWDGMAADAGPRANGSRPPSAAELRRALAQAEDDAEQDLMSAGSASTHGPIRRATMSSLSPAARTALSASAAANGRTLPAGRQRATSAGGAGLARAGGSGNFAGLIVGGRLASGLTGCSTGGP